MNDLPLFAFVPYVKGSDTSRAAAESIRPHVSELEGEIVAFVNLHGGATCDEVEMCLQLSHQTASARLKDLQDKGLIKDSGARRKTRSGRAARVYVAA